MQSVSSRIWTRVAVSISYDDNHYTTGTSFINRQEKGKTKKEQKCILTDLSIRHFTEMLAEL